MDNKIDSLIDSSSGWRLSQSGVKLFNLVHSYSEAYRGINFTMCDEIGNEIRHLIIPEISSWTFSKKILPGDLYKRSPGRERFDRLKRLFSVLFDGTPTPFPLPVFKIPFKTDVPRPYNLDTLRNYTIVSGRDEAESLLSVDPTLEGKLTMDSILWFDAKYSELVSSNTPFSLITETISTIMALMSRAETEAEFMLNPWIQRLAGYVYSLKWDCNRRLPKGSPVMFDFLTIRGKKDRRSYIGCPDTFYDIRCNAMLVFADMYEFILTSHKDSNPALMSKVYFDFLHIENPLTRYKVLEAFDEYATFLLQDPFVNVGKSQGLGSAVMYCFKNPSGFVLDRSVDYLNPPMVEIKKGTYDDSLYVDFYSKSIEDVFKFLHEEKLSNNASCFRMMLDGDLYYIYFLYAWMTLSTPGAIGYIRSDPRMVTYKYLDKEKPSERIVRGVEQFAKLTGVQLPYTTIDVPVANLGDVKMVNNIELSSDISEAISAVVKESLSMSYNQVYTGADLLSQILSTLTSKSKGGAASETVKPIKFNIIMKGRQYPVTDNSKHGAAFSTQLFSVLSQDFDSKALGSLVGRIIRKEVPSGRATRLVFLVPFEEYVRLLVEAIMARYQLSQDNPRNTNFLGGQDPSTNLGLFSIFKYKWGTVTFSIDASAWDQNIGHAVQRAVAIGFKKGMSEVPLNSVSLFSKRYTRSIQSLCEYAVTNRQAIYTFLEHNILPGWEVAVVGTSESKSKYGDFETWYPRFCEQKKVPALMYLAMQSGAPGTLAINSEVNTVFLRKCFKYMKTVFIDNKVVKLNFSDPDIVVVGDDAVCQITLDPSSSKSEIIDGLMNVYEAYSTACGIETNKYKSIVRMYLFEIAKRICVYGFIIQRLVTTRATETAPTSQYFGDNMNIDQAISQVRFSRGSHLIETTLFKNIIAGAKMGLVDEKSIPTSDRKIGQSAILYRSVAYSYKRSFGFYATVPIQLLLLSEHLCSIIWNTTETSIRWKYLYQLLASKVPDPTTDVTKAFADSLMSGNVYEYSTNTTKPNKKISNPYDGIKYIKTVFHKEIEFAKASYDKLKENKFDWPIDCTIIAPERKMYESMSLALKSVTSMIQDRRNEAHRELLNVVELQKYNRQTVLRMVRAQSKNISSWMSYGLIYASRELSKEELQQVMVPHATLNMFIDGRYGEMIRFCRNRMAMNKIRITATLKRLLFRRTILPVQAQESIIGELVRRFGGVKPDLKNFTLVCNTFGCVKNDDIQRALNIINKSTYTDFVTATGGYSISNEALINQDRNEMKKFITVVGNSHLTDTMNDIIYYSLYSLILLVYYLTGKFHCLTFSIKGNSDKKMLTMFNTGLITAHDKYFS